MNQPLNEHKLLPSRNLKSSDNFLASERVDPTFLIEKTIKLEPLGIGGPGRDFNHLSIKAWNYFAQGIRKIRNQTQENAIPICKG